MRDVTKRRISSMMREKHGSVTSPCWGRPPSAWQDELKSASISLRVPFDAVHLSEVGLNAGLVENLAPRATTYIPNLCPQSTPAHMTRNGLGWQPISTRTDQGGRETEREEIKGLWDESYVSCTLRVRWYASKMDSVRRSSCRCATSCRLLRRHRPASRRGSP